MDHSFSKLEQGARSARVGRFARAGITSYHEFERTGALDDLGKVIGDFQQAVSLIPDDHADKPIYLTHLGISFRSRFQRTGSLSDLEHAIKYLQHTMSLTPDGHVDKPIYLSNLGTSLEGRFGHTGSLSDLEDAIKYLQQAVSLTPDGHANKPGCLNNLGICFESQFRHTGSLSDLEEAINNQRHAVSLTRGDHADKPMYLSNLGTSLETRFGHTGSLSDLEDAIKHLGRAVSLTPDGHTTKPGRFNNLGNSYHSRFRHTESPGDLRDAIEYLQQAVLLTPDGHVNKPGRLNNLGNALESRFRRTGLLSDIENAIDNLQQAVLLTPSNHANKPMYLSNLGKYIEGRFGSTGLLNDLEEAIRNQQQAVSLAPDNHPDKSMYLNNLGTSLESRFRHTVSLNDLKDAINIQQQAVRLTSDGHTNKPMYLSNLGTYFESRFRHTKLLSDLDGAIEHLQRAVFLTPDSHATKLRRLNNLGISFESRFMHTGSLSDLEDAIKHLQRAVSLTPHFHVNKSVCLNNLGISFQSRFRQTGSLSDLEDAIKHLRQAVSLTSDGHPNIPMYLSNLGNSLESRFEHTRLSNDLEDAIKHLQRAVVLTPDSHVAKPGRLNNLGNAFQSRFRRTGSLGDIEDAIDNLQQAVLLTPDNHANKPMYLSDLGNSFESRSKHTGSLDDLAEATSKFQLAATSDIGPILLRCHTSLRWARLEANNGSLSALPAYRQAINLLSQAAWIGDPITKHHSRLTNLGDIPREAAAFALDAGHPDLALEWLEQGRSVIWNQLLHLRTSVDHLCQAHPDICAEFVRTSHELQSAASRGLSINTSDDVENTDSLEETQRYHHLAEQWNSLVKNIQSLPSFQDFLIPKKVSVLKEAASLGPVVVISAHQHRCDALVLERSRDQVLHIPLDRLRYRDLEWMWMSLRQYFANPRRAQRRDDRSGRSTTIEGSRIEQILQRIYWDIIQPILQGLGITTSTFSPPNLPRIWWCPTGPLTFLPLHAACYRIGDKIDGTFNYVVSSYIPTINALLEARAVKQQSFNQLVGIAMTTPPVPTSLPWVETEITVIETLCSDNSRRFEILRDVQATSRHVLASMANNSWIHLACHCVQDKQKPANSGFRLHDRRLTIADITAEPFVHADLAFLSGCQSATGGENALDEVLHITGAMLKGGYRNVIGTMWAIPDEVAPRISAKVYKVLLSGEEPDSDRAAQALHEAVKEVRDSDHDLLTHWVPFVHYGV